MVSLLGNIVPYCAALQSIAPHQQTRSATIQSQPCQDEWTSGTDLTSPGQATGPSEVLLSGSDFQRVGHIAIDVDPADVGAVW